MKKYPSMHDYGHSQLIWGWTEFGIGVYTCDLNFFWPDPTGYTRAEYDRWVAWIHKNGYEVPEAYRNCYQVTNDSSECH